VRGIGDAGPLAAGRGAAGQAWRADSGWPGGDALRSRGGAEMRLRPAVTFHVGRADRGPEGTVPLRNEVLTCGKRGDLALHLDPFVASTQARFAFADKHRLAVEDVGGGNGVFLRVRREHELTGGGELRVGRQRLVVESVVPATPAPDGTLFW